VGGVKFLHCLSANRIAAIGWLDGVEMGSAVGRGGRSEIGGIVVGVAT
jgi:hypothetical protein